MTQFLCNDLSNLQQTRARGFGSCFCCLGCRELGGPVGQCACCGPTTACLPPETGSGTDVPEKARFLEGLLFGEMETSTDKKFRLSDKIDSKGYKKNHRKSCRNMTGLGRSLPLHTHARPPWPQLLFLGHQPHVSFDPSTNPFLDGSFPLELRFPEQPDVFNFMLPEKAVG